ncbi:MAG TPA: VOC family protein [Frankiaceae bacterium]|jgi:catechol 2,3-dioxygenase-like lactoylglutathione lyase family enzyme|nr:VOC family protein [Frankiaceae bacterium]
MEVLNSRLLITPADPAASRHFYGEVLGLAVAREFGPPEHPGIVYFAGGGFLELSGQGAPGVPAATLRLWLQVRDAGAEWARLQELVRSGDLEERALAREPELEPWGLIEMWLLDPDGMAVALVEVPPEHPLRRDPRG